MESTDARREGWWREGISGGLGWTGHSGRMIDVLSYLFLQGDGGEREKDLRV